jgi:hypothetical protein
VTTAQGQLVRAQLFQPLLPLLTILLFSATASARGPRLHLSWRHPVGTMCPTGPILQSDVEELVGTGQFVSLDEAEVVVRGEVKQSPTGFAAHLQVESLDGRVLGTRDLSASAEDCASLRRTLALVLVMLLDTPFEPATGPSNSHNVTRFGANVNLLSGALPRITPGVGLSLAVDHDRDLRLRLDATYWLPVRVEDAAGHGATFHAVGLNAVLCPRLTRGTKVWGLWLCGGAELGVLHATAHRLAHPAGGATRLLAQADLELVLSWGIGRAFELWAASGLAAALSRPRFYMRDDDGAQHELHRPAGVGALFRLGLTIVGS